MRGIKIRNRQYHHFANNMIDYLDYPMNWKAIRNKFWRWQGKRPIFKTQCSLARWQQTTRTRTRKRCWGSGSRPRCVPAVRPSPSKICCWMTDRRWIPKDTHVPLFHTTGQWSRGVVLAMTARQWLLRHLGTQSVSFLHKGGKWVARPGNPGTCRLFSALVTVWPSQDGGGDERQEGGQFLFLTALLPHSTFQNLCPSHLLWHHWPFLHPHPTPAPEETASRREGARFPFHWFIHSFMDACMHCALAVFAKFTRSHSSYVSHCARSWGHREQNQTRSVQEDDRET